MDCDLFCRVVDNYGDVGVTWRVATQLGSEQGWSVTLVVDDLDTLARLVRAVMPDRLDQKCQGVRIVAWAFAEAALRPATVVIEAFGSALPDAYVARMPSSSRVWCNLEYLSAESWVAECHGLASPGSAVPKYFFFPGFTDTTGGLPIERGYAARRRTRSAGSSAGGSNSLGRDETIYVFCYDTPALGDLERIWRADSNKRLALCAPGPATARLVLDRSVDADSALLVRAVDFKPQSEFDHLLWACDHAVVRGEDSFVRAQLAGIPFIWHVYPQSGGEQFKKLDAFATIYCVGLSQEASSAWLRINHEFNRGEVTESAWHAYARSLAELRAHAQKWSRTLLAKPALSERLATFVRAKLNYETH